VNFSRAWFDETHLTVAKVAGYQKWFNAAGADVAKLKLGHKEGHKHYVNNARDTVVTTEMVLAQVEKYNQIDPSGHLYGATIASIRDYIEVKKKGRYAEYHLAYAAHYIGDLSMPLHHTLYEDFNRRYHSKMDSIVNDEVLKNLDKIKVYPIEIKTEQSLIGEKLKKIKDNQLILVEMLYLSDAKISIYSNILEFYPINF
jgi:hypothetical protein